MSGKMEKTRRIGFSIFRKDLYISMQLIRSRLKENRLMIATISMLVAITILGANLSAIIKANGEKYYRELYLTEFVLTTSQTMSFEEGEKLYEDLQGAVSGPVSELYQASYPVTIGAESFQYGLADINALGRSEIIENKNYEADAIIVSKSFAKNIGCEEGDRICVTSPEIIARDADGNPLDSVEKEGKEFSFQVGFIGEDDLMQGNDLLIDTSQMDFVNDSVWLGSIYLDGDNEEIQDELSELKGKYPVIKWASYTDAIKTSEQKVNSRFSVLDVVVKILVLVAAIGWIHSLQNILVSRGRDYSIIRMLGVKRSRIAKILIYQIAIYILAGVLGGVLLGTVLLELFMCLEEHRLVFHLEYMGVVWVIGLMLTFCVLLLPAINKICRRSIAEE
jgi:hypothetical protein